MASNWIRNNVALAFLVALVTALAGCTAGDEAIEDPTTQQAPEDTGLGDTGGDMGDTMAPTGDAGMEDGGADTTTPTGEDGVMNETDDANATADMDANATDTGGGMANATAGGDTGGADTSIY